MGGVKLIRYVNGKRKCGKDDSSGVITRLSWKAADGCAGDVRDQHGWGGKVPRGKLMPLKDLATAAGIPHNIPERRGVHKKAKPAHTGGSSEGTGGSSDYVAKEYEYGGANKDDSDCDGDGDGDGD